MYINDININIVAMYFLNIKLHNFGVTGNV